MRVACAQYAIADGDPGRNLEKSLRYLEDAARQGADLVVLPELANSGCDFGDRGRGLAEEVPGGPTVRAWRAFAEASGLHVVGGLLEREGETLRNSAVLAGPGLFFRYRKTHLWDREKLLYEAGDELPVFETPLGSIGLLVCYDAWFPEAARALAGKGARIICVPANAPDDWVPEARRPGGLTMLNVHCAAHANANRLFVACANRVGDGYLGRSCVVEPSGGVIALGSETGERLLLADVDLDRAATEKRLTDLSHAFDDRNPRAYGIPSPGLDAFPEGMAREDRTGKR